MIPYGFDRAKEAAQDALKKKCKKYAHSVLIKPTKYRSMIFFIVIFHNIAEIFCFSEQQSDCKFLALCK